MFGDKSIPNDSNYQIRKAIMTKIRAPGPESQEAQFSWPPVIVISQSSIINHGTGGSKYWTQREAEGTHFLRYPPTMAVKAVLLNAANHLASSPLPLSNALLSPGPIIE